jgi:hypothetical protein
MRFEPKLHGIPAGNHASRGRIGELAAVDRRVAVRFEVLTRDTDLESRNSILKFVHGGSAALVALNST